MEHEPDGSTWQSTCDIWLAALDNTYRELVQAAAAFVPGLVGTTLLFVLGWLLAIALRALILRLGTGSIACSTRCAIGSGRIPRSRPPLFSPP